MNKTTFFLYLQYDYTYYMRSPGRYLDNITSWEHGHIKVNDRSAYWPNNPDYLPSKFISLFNFFSFNTFASEHAFFIEK